LDDLKAIIPTFNLSSDCKETYLMPINDFCSIVYLLFTQANRSSPCYFEPKIEEFNDCEFNRRRETKILIHGYLVKLLPGNQFELIKDALLSATDYNVIIVNWTRYNQAPYEKAVLNAKSVGTEVAKLINFLVLYEVICYGSRNLHPWSYDKDDAWTIICLLNIYAIIAEKGKETKGLGIPFPIGYINFYPNGGDEQPACVLGRNYTNTDGKIREIKSELDLAFCRHDICPLYFLYSIQSCDFLSRECDSYSKYEMRWCSSKSHPIVSMGLYARKPAGIASHSKLYLKTGKSAPFCLTKAKTGGILNEESCY
ncbi:hypothetical protein AVEN_271431-1, partial [Araneus ventricosus]